VFERFTDRARRVLVLAQEEARLLNHSFIGTKHILLGLVREGEGVAIQVLISLGADPGRVRQRVIQLMSGAQETQGAFAPPMRRTSTESRQTFAAGTEGFAHLVSEVHPEQWTLPGLGTWDVRGLVGHGARALSTIETHLT